MKTRATRSHQPSNRSLPDPLSRGKLRIEYVPIRSLRPSEKNSRLHPSRQVEKLRRAIDEFGFLIPALIDERNILIAGHARIEAAEMCGLQTVPCLRTTHLSEAQKRAFAIVDNRLAQDAAWDFQVLAQELEFLRVEGVDLQMTGFEIPELEGIFAAADASPKDTGDDQFPQLDPTRAVTKQNNLWVLGEHRLVCADARRRETFAVLLDGHKADLVFADPPFNIKIRGPVSGKGRVKHREFAEASGEKTSAQFEKFLEDSFVLLAEYSASGAIQFICTDWRHLGEMLEAGRRVYSELKNLVVWSKNNAGLGSFYRSQHELILVWKNGRGKHTNNVQLGKHGRNRTNVRTYAGANSFSSDRLTDLAMHPTVKPVALVADAILDCSKRDDLVLDSFGGSGTTLIACERTNRKARLIEIDPLFCDQTVRRWQKLMGRLAVNAAGVPFSDLEKSSKAGKNDGTKSSAFSG
jgi:DNA modification methylase